MAILNTNQESESRMSAAMKSPDHLKRWLEESGRRYLVFDGLELIDALPWPDGIEALMQLISCYRDYRSVKDTGRKESIEVDSGEVVTVSVFKSEVLELEELDRVIRYLIGVASEEAKRRQVKWSIEQSPL